MCYSSNHAVYECPLPNLRIGSTALVSAMSVALVSNKKAQEQIIEVDRLLKLKAQPNPAVAPAGHIVAPTSCPAPSDPLPAIPEESPHEWDAPLVWASDIAAFISWKLANSETKIPQLDKATVLAAAKRNAGGPLSVCSDLLCDGHPIRWPTVEVLSDWACWLNGEIPMTPGTGSWARTNIPENPLGMLFSSTHMAEPWLTPTLMCMLPPGCPQSDVSSMFLLPSGLLSDLEKAPMVAQKQFRDSLAQLQSLYPDSTEEDLGVILGQAKGDVQRAIAVMESPHSPYHVCTPPPILIVPPVALVFSYKTDLKLQAMIDTITAPSQPPPPAETVALNPFQPPPPSSG